MSVPVTPPGGKSLNDFIDSYAVLQVLRDNMQVNINEFCDDFTAEEKRILLRMQLIMVRQCLNDFGVL